MRTGTRLVLAAAPLAAALLLPTAAWAWPRADPDDPFTMTVDDVACGTGRAPVRLHNPTRHPVRFALHEDGRSLATGSIRARDSIVRYVTVRRGSAAEVAAYTVEEGESGILVDSTRVDNDCAWGHGRRLPYTGPPADLMAKLATAGGLVITGGILWWYGSIWPRSTP
ncbi:hypothetical protein SAMN05421874_105265 [Nonomuraea maritima]|uniref:Tissue inhibitor of metalloproteinase n=1 Tax=Nonomuraea maritima TaxID=683260 RepID=A0A1G8ZG21_9ACTN|nr:hypothetical protein [Nonomuraea maritima]SDK14001.1 hypothetical protein SAMN05421874_105265 [Nonomuraea maritima]